MKDLNDYIMYFALLSLYVQDRDSNILDPLPLMVLDVYLVKGMIEIIGEKFNISEEQLLELSKQKIKSTEAATFLAEYGQRIVSE